ncbi:MAG: peptidylprolyl isomerase [Planctomycetes bacterium]|nr:peptidylprolyl isomerase [Planctomycetota bacterium]
MDASELANIHVKLVTNMGEMEIEFYPDKAPTHVRNFIALSLSKFYEGKVFHRVIKGFMIQGGCPQGTGTGSHGSPMQLEISDLKHDRGVLSMARTNVPNSATCQFFIMHQKYPSLDGQYSAFGKLVDGYDTLDKIATTSTGPQDRPREEMKMQEVIVLKRNGDTLRASN